MGCPSGIKHYISGWKGSAEYIFCPPRVYTLLWEVMRTPKFMNKINFRLQLSVRTDINCSYQSTTEGAQASGLELVTGG